MQGEEFELYRTNAVRNCVLVLITLGPVLGARAWSHGFEAVAVSVVGASALGLGILARMRRGASPQWGGAAGMCVLFAVITFANTRTGGFHYTNFGWFFIVPVVAALLLGTRAAFGWGAAVIATGVAFWSAQQLGVEFPLRVPEGERAGRDLFNRILQTTALVAVAVAFVRGHEHVARALLDTNAELEREKTRVQLLQLAAMAANEAETVDEAVAQCAQKVTGVTGWPLAVHWAPDETGRWRFCGHWAAGASDRFDGLVEQSRSLRFRMGELALGRIAENAEPVTAAAPAMAKGSPRGARALEAGLGSVAAIPVVSQGRAFAILEFWSDNATLVDAHTLGVLRELGRQLGRVAQRLELEERVRRTQRLESVAKLAAGIAHEINNPMTYVRSNLGALELELGELRKALEKPVDPADAETRFAECHELVGDAIEGADRTVAIVRDIRDFARDDREHREPVDLAEVVKGALRLCRPRLDASIQVVTSFDARAWAHGDPSQLQQVLVNLIANGAQAMPEGGRLEVATRREGDRTLVTVTDAGEGIAPEARDRIFDPFFTTKPVGEGTGLGLYVSHGIVDAHRGEIRAEAAHPRGTRFEIVLPALEDDDGAPDVA